MKIGCIGAGNMGGAILRGMVAAGFRASDIVVYDTDNAKMLALFEECGICMASDANAVIAQADAVLLAVKPQMLGTLLPACAGAFHRHTPLVISIAAGKTIAALEGLLGQGLPILRAMPNMAARVGEAMTAICTNAQANETHKSMARAVFEAVGAVVELDESLFSAFAALAGCSPAFTLLYLDTLAEAGVRFGISKATALQIAAQSILGATRLWQETGEHPRVLADQVCSPAGTTIAGVCALKEQGFEHAVHAAVRASVERDQTL